MTKEVWIYVCLLRETLFQFAFFTGGVHRSCALKLHTWLLSRPLYSPTLRLYSSERFHWWLNKSENK